MAESVKKPKTARKPRATTSAATPAAPKKAAAPKKKAASKQAKVVAINVTHEKIAALAHHFFEERGYTHGGDTEDWLRAEAKLRGKAS